MPDELDAYLDPPKRPRDRVHSIASRLRIDPNLADDYLKVTQLESGHNVNVRDSSKGAKGFGQVMPDVKGGTTRTIGGRRYNLRNPDENIEAGLKLFQAGGSDPVGRRLEYFGGAKARKAYERTGRIPNISDGNMTAAQYVKATGGTQAPQQPQGEIDQYLDPLDDYLDPLPQPKTRFGTPQQSVRRQRIKTSPFAGAQAGVSGIRQPASQVYKSVGGFRGQQPDTIRGQHMAAVPRVASEGVLEGAAGWTQSLESLAEYLPDVVRNVGGVNALANMPRGQYNPVAQKLQKASNALRHAAEQTEIDPATGKPFREAMSYWQSVPLDVLQAGVKSGFDIPRYVLLSRVGGPIMGFGVEGLLSSPPEERSKGALTGLATGAAFHGLSKVPALNTRLKQAGALAGLGAGQAAAEQYASTGKVDFRPTASSAITMGGLGLLSKPEGARRGVQSEAKSDVAAQREAVESTTAQRAVEARPNDLGRPAKAAPERIRSELPNQPTTIEQVEPTAVAARNEQSNFGGSVQPLPEIPSETPQRFYHRDWGEVVRLEDQSGARKGRTKVAEVDDPTKIHYPRTADLRGRGNERMVPVKTEEVKPAEPNLEHYLEPEGQRVLPAEAPPLSATAAPAEIPSVQAASPARPAASSPERPSILGPNTEQKNPGVYEGKRFWTGTVNLLDGKIENVYSREQAEATGSRHQLYMKPADVDGVNSGERAIFWLDKKGEVQADWGTKVPAGIKESIKAQLEQPKAMAAAAGRSERAEIPDLQKPAPVEQGVAAPPEAPTKPSAEPTAPVSEVPLTAEKRQEAIELLEDVIKTKKANRYSRFRG